MATIVPILPPDTKWREWLISQVYTGQAGTGVYVPNVNDRIFDWNQGYFRVISVDESTGLSEWVKWEEPATADEGDPTDILSGVGPGYASESWRCYIDTSVLPYRLCIDSRLKVYGSLTSSAKIFQGSNISAEGKVISKVYDSSGNFISESIPLDLVVMPDVENRSVKTVRPAHTTSKLDDGEIVTVVLYDDSGNVVSRAALLVMNTAFIRSSEASQRYISSIQLESPFISKATPNLVEIPTNVTLDSLALGARVNYSDGYKDVAIDGSKVKLLGMETFVSSIQGMKVPLVLRYEVGSDETAYAGAGIGNRVVTESYQAKVVGYDGAYSVKLFCFPCWNTDLLEYELHWFLYNMNRETWYSVDAYVELASTSNPFKPRLYGTQQELAFVLDLSKVDGRFAKWRYVQNVKLTLLAVGSEDRSLWNIVYDATYDHPFGVDTFARLTHVSGSNYKCVLNEVHKYQDIWLQRFYYDAFPLYNDQLETKAPKPTHFILSAGGIEQEYSIDAWANEFILPVQIPAGQNLYIHWLKRDGTTDLHLGVSGVRACYTSSN